MNPKQIKQSQKSYSNLTGGVPVWNHDLNGFPCSELIPFESQLERDFILRAAFCVDCYSIRRSKPIEWIDPQTGREWKYEPDFEVQVCNEDMDPVNRYLIEVQCSVDLEKQGDPQFDAARRHGESTGWQLFVQTEKDICDDFLRNAKFLSDFRQHPYLEYPFSEVYGVEKHIKALLYELEEATPSSLLACISDDKWKSAEYIPYLWRLLYHHEIRANLLEPLTMESLIWHPEHHTIEEGIGRCFLE